ncbi:MAG: NTP transferase domain-containing protein [Proteobacteria bacterium]|nr:NTP transferase domain-containing protein [Pseudomonadota bacterium]
MKVVIPAAGKGTRLRPHTFSRPKPLIRFAGKSILEHIVSNLNSLNISEYIFIVGYLKEQFVNYFDGNINGTKLSFVEQKEQKGLADAVYLVKEKFPKDEDILIVLSDTLFDVKVDEMKEQDESFVCVHEVSDPSKFGIVYTDGDYVTDLIEKPKESKSNLAIVGIYYFKSAFELFRNIEFILNNNIKTAGEFQITDALNHYVKTGKRLKTFRIDKWFDCGNRNKLLETQKYYIKRFNNHKDYKNSKIIEPVYIDESAVIENSIVGPYVSVDRDSVIKNSIINNSIIGSAAEIKNVNLSLSILGDESKYIGTPESIDLGSKSEIVKGGNK